VSYIREFDRQEGLTRIPDWLYLTGSRAQLRRVWKRYGVTAQVLPAGSMIGHGDHAFVIDQALPGFVALAAPRRSGRRSPVTGHLSGHPRHRLGGRGYSGSAASHNNFWQLFVCPAGCGRWRLATPPGVPGNGGLVVAGGSGQSVVTAFRPSQYLTFTISVPSSTARPDDACDALRQRTAETEPVGNVPSAA
jgi:hypothetical protein